jgi:signal transduction histidine kinase
MRRTRAATGSLRPTLRRFSRLAVAAALCADLAALALANVTAPVRMALAGPVAGCLLLLTRRAAAWRPTRPWWCTGLNLPSWKPPGPSWACRMANHIREQERRRLGQDLHDSLGPTLAAVVMQTDAACSLMATDPRAARNAIIGLKGETRNAMAEVRRLAHARREPVLQGMSLGCALRAQAARFGYATGGGLAVRVDAPDSEPLPEAITLAAYRIACEALTNVAKHARARSATVRVWPAPGGAAIWLEITDDGTGLPPEPCPGFGLDSMRQRARELGGMCTIENAVPHGTRVLAVLPIKPATAAAAAVTPATGAQARRLPGGAANGARGRTTIRRAPERSTGALPP